MANCPFPTLRGEEADIALHYCAEEGLVLHAILHNIARYCVRYRPLLAVTAAISREVGAIGIASQCRERANVEMKALIEPDNLAWFL